MRVLLSSGPGIPGILWAVVGVTLAAGVACLGVAIWFAVENRRMTEPLRQAVRIAGRRAQEHYQTVLPLMASDRPVAPDRPAGRPAAPPADQPADRFAAGTTSTEERTLAPGVDFSGIAELAEALAKLRPSGQLLIAAIVFLTIAMATAVAGLAAL